MNMDNGKSIENFNDIPEFYKEIINCWVEFGGGQTKTPTNFREIRNQNIWGNKYIKFNNKSLIYKNWIDSNLLYVNDITDEIGRISQDYLIEKLKNKINYFSEYSRQNILLPLRAMVVSLVKSILRAIRSRNNIFFFYINSIFHRFFF
jgi:hypothetical protein